MWTNFLLFLANQYVHKKGKKCRLLIFNRVSVKQTDINGECVFNKLLTGYFFYTWKKKNISVWDPSEQLSQNEASHLRLLPWSLLEPAKRNSHSVILIWRDLCLNCGTRGVLWSIPLISVCYVEPGWAAFNCWVSRIRLKIGLN